VPATPDAACHPPGDTRGEKGVVLLLVLVLIVLSVSSVYAFARASLLDVSSAKERMSRARAELAARSGITLAVRAIQDDAASTDPVVRQLESARDPWGQLAASPIALPGGGELRVIVEDAGRRIPLNAVVGAEGGATEGARQFLQAALERVIENMPGRPEDKRYDIEAVADGIIDWIDADTETRLGDAEATFYEDRRAPRPPVDRPLFSIGELAAVPGVDARLLDALGAYFSPSPDLPRSGGAGLNPNTAPAHVLGLMYLVVPGRSGVFLEKADIFRLLKARQEGRLACPGEAISPDCTSLAELLGQPPESIFPPIAYQSAVFTVRSEAVIRDARACVRAVLRRGEEEVETLAYRLGC
jgi:type II secretory pathway component PulK